MPEDYSFMKTGHSMIKDENNINISKDEEDNILSMLTMFSSNALLNAGRYVELCKRNGITNQDMKNGLIYEVFEFTKRDNFKEELENVKKKFESDEPESDGEDDTDEENYDEENFIVADSELVPYARIESLDNIESKDKEFIDKYHNYIDNWGSWVPSNSIEIIMKNAIDKIKIN